MRTIIIGALALAACSEEIPTRDAGRLVPSPDVIQGAWFAPDGAGCVFVAGFNGTGYSATLGRYCATSPRAQWSTTYGSYEASRPEPTDADTIVEVGIRFTVIQSACVATGSVLELAGLLDGNTLTLDDGATSRRLVRAAPADIPGADLPEFGCFAADGTFARDVPRPN